MLEEAAAAFTKQRLPGTFLLVTGRDIKTKFEIVEGRITSVVTALRGLRHRPRIRDKHADDGLMKPGTEKRTNILRFNHAERWILGKDDAMLTKGGASMTEDGGPSRSCVFILERSAKKRTEPGTPHA